MARHWLFDRRQNILKYQYKVVQSIQCVLEKSSGTVYILRDEQTLHILYNTYCTYIDIVLA